MTPPRDGGADSGGDDAATLPRRCFSANASAGLRRMMSLGAPRPDRCASAPPQPRALPPRPDTPPGREGAGFGARPPRRSYLARRTSAGALVAGAAPHATAPGAPSGPGAECAAASLWRTAADVAAPTRAPARVAAARADPAAGLAAANADDLLIGFDAYLAALPMALHAASEPAARCYVAALAHALAGAARRRLDRLPSQAAALGPCEPAMAWLAQHGGVAATAAGCHGVADTCLARSLLPLPTTRAHVDHRLGPGGADTGLCRAAACGNLVALQGAVAATPPDARPRLLRAGLHAAFVAAAAGGHLACLQALWFHADAQGRAEMCTAGNGAAMVAAAIAGHGHVLSWLLARDAARATMLEVGGPAALEACARSGDHVAMRLLAPLVRRREGALAAAIARVDVQALAILCDPDLPMPTPAASADRARLQATVQACRANDLAAAETLWAGITDTAAASRMAGEVLVVLCREPGVETMGRFRAVVDAGTWQRACTGLSAAAFADAAGNGHTDVLLSALADPEGRADHVGAWLRGDGTTLPPLSRAAAAGDVVAVSLLCRFMRRAAGSIAQLPAPDTAAAACAAAAAGHTDLAVALAVPGRCGGTGDSDAATMARAAMAAIRGGHGATFTTFAALYAAHCGDDAPLWHLALQVTLGEGRSAGLAWLLADTFRTGIAAAALLRPVVDAAAPDPLALAFAGGHDISIRMLMGSLRAARQLPATALREAVVSRAAAAVAGGVRTLALALQLVPAAARAEVAAGVPWAALLELPPATIALLAHHFAPQFWAALASRDLVAACQRRRPRRDGAEVMLVLLAHAPPPQRPQLVAHLGAELMEAVARYGDLDQLTRARAALADTDCTGWFEAKLFFQQVARHGSTALAMALADAADDAQLHDLLSWWDCAAVRPLLCRTAPGFAQRLLDRLTPTFWRAALQHWPSSRGDAPRPSAPLLIQLRRFVPAAALRDPPPAVP